MRRASFRNHLQSESYRYKVDEILRSALREARAARGTGEGAACARGRGA